MGVNAVSAQVQVGIISGLNSTGIAGDEPGKGDFTSGFGYSLGAVTEINVFTDVTINMQPIYISRNSGIEYDVKNQYEPYDSIGIILKYFELPFNVKIIADNKISYVTAGMVIAVPLASKVRNNRTGTEIDFKDYLESFLVNASFGVGIQFKIGKPLIFIELLYMQSLSNLTKRQVENLEFDNKIKLNGFQLNTGLLFRL